MSPTLLSVMNFSIFLMMAPQVIAPPGDKKEVEPTRYAVRLAAATAIEDAAAKADALLSIAADAAENGEGAVVKKCMAALPKSDPSAITIQNVYKLINRLAAAGYEAEALEAANRLEPRENRGPALAGIAAGAKEGLGAFWRACEDGKDDRVAALLETVAANTKDKDGETGLMKAAANGHVAIVKRLLAAEKVEAWEVDKQGRTALMNAAENGQDAIVRVILGKYSTRPYPKDEPLDLTDSQGRTALMLAADKGHAGVVRVLLDVRYANALKNDRFLTIQREEGPPVPTPFDASLVDRDRKDNDGKTALDLAEAGKHAGVVELLKKAGK